MKTSEELLENTPIITGMVAPHHVEFLIDMLEEVIVSEIDGDVVELGCNIGTTSVFIRKLLDMHNSSKEFCVYDSFEGLPDKTEHDDLSLPDYQKGDCKCSKDVLLDVFRQMNLKTPTINEGWFAEIPDKNYPEKISFAFLDGDFYTSIIDSLNKIYDKLQPGAIVCVHDYGWEKLPGPKKACFDFLKDKPEEMQQEVEGVGFFEKEGKK